MNTNNKSVKEIRQIYDDLLESIRHNLSLKLMNTSEDNPLKVHIPLKHGAVGLSTLEMPTITEIYQQPLRESSMCALRRITITQSWTTYIWKT